MKNTAVGIVGMTLSIVATFIAKSVFIKLLGIEYNGVNSLFTGILSTLNLAELGFAAAVAFALYKPLNDENKETVAALMNYFKKIYTTIAFVVAVAGSLCVPFLQYLIKENISTLPFTLNKLKLYYILFLADSVFSYLLAYKRTLLTADQNIYVVNFIDYAAKIILNIFQIVALLITKNYYIFLAVMIAKTILSNVIIQAIADKRYPYIKQYAKAVPSKTERKDILGNVKAMFVHRVGDVMVINTVTIVISAIVGLRENGFYGNYAMITANVNAFFDIVFIALTASVGNLCVDREIDHQYRVFRRINFLGLWAAYFCVICYMCLLNPFITLWLGKEYLLSLPVVAVIGVGAVVTYYGKTLYTFRDAKGLFKLDWYAPIIESALAVALGIIMGKRWGVFGILLGYTIAKIIIRFPIEFYVIFKKGFNGKSPLRIIIYDLSNVVLSVGVCVLVYFILDYLPTTFWAFIVRFAVCIILPNIVFILCTFWTEEFKYYKNLVKGVLIKMGEKLKAGKILPAKTSLDSDVMGPPKETFEEIEKVKEIDGKNDEDTPSDNLS